MGEDGERVDEYGLGPRGSLAEAVRAVVDLLGMQPCEVCADGFISCMNISTLMKIFWITEQYNYVSTLEENKSSRKWTMISGSRFSFLLCFPELVTTSKLGCFLWVNVKMNVELDLVSNLFPLQPKEVNLFLCSRILIIKALLHNYSVFCFRFSVPKSFQKLLFLVYKIWFGFRNLALN